MIHVFEAVPGVTFNIEEADEVWHVLDEIHTQLCFKLEKTEKVRKAIQVIEEAMDKLED